MWSFFRRRRRKRLMAEPLADARRRALKSHVPHYRRADAATRSALEDRVKVMLAERSWEGCDGLSVTDEMRVAIAGHAAVMLLGTRDYFFDSVASILIFPDVIERYHEGVVSHAVGEAWEEGHVVLTWPEIQLASEGDDGRNVVIHEFAHHLDGLDGEMGGSIQFPSREDQRRWDELAGEEFEALVRDVDAGRRTLLDPYGATDEAEFFAVASEAFFETPEPLARRHPELYELLVKFYGLDPRHLESA